MEYKCFKYTLEDHIAHVTLSRGDELNTMIKAFWSELPNLIDEISNGFLSTGNHSIIWNGSSNSSGVYFVNISDGKSAISKKIILMK